MRRLLRPVGICMTLVLLQLLLVESGYACQMPAMRDASSTAMAGMPMPGSTGHAPSAPTQPARSDRQQSPCQFPWAPNGCQTMAPCSPAALTVASAPDLHPAPAHVAPLRLELLAPPSLSRAPELPPPRA